jgi:AcrR family transcriptional regulator
MRRGMRGLNPLGGQIARKRSLKSVVYGATAHAGRSVTRRARLARDRRVFNTLMYGLRDGTAGKDGLARFRPRGTGRKWNGHDALKAQTLAVAASMGVTRGSFYWHFEDLEAFKHDLIGHWTDLYDSDELVRAVVRKGDAQAQLIGHDDACVSFRRVDGARRSGPGRPRTTTWRAWSTAVDWRRIRFAEQLLEALGVAEPEVGPRARMLYWAAIGRLMMARPSDQGPFRRGNRGSGKPHRKRKGPKTIQGYIHPMHNRTDKLRARRRHPRPPPARPGRAATDGRATGG